LVIRSDRELPITIIPCVPFPVTKASCHRSACLAERSTQAQARERIADARRFNPQTIMPAYFSTEGLNNVASPYQGQTILTPQGLEDILSYLFLPAKGKP
jgi:hypothetical protein